MQDAEEPNLSTEVFGIPGDLEQSFGAGAKQKAVDFTLVLQRQRSQLMRQCEDDVDVRRRQKVAAARIEPAVAGGGLALRTMPISTRVVRDGLIVATGTGIDMSAQHRCSAVQDGGKNLDMKPGQPLTTAIEECGARRADNVSHLHGWLRHLLGFGDLRSEERRVGKKCRS